MRLANRLLLWILTNLRCDRSTAPRGCCLFGYAVGAVGLAVLQFRAYLLDHRGHIVQRVDLVCDDEDAARDRARRLVAECTVELWLSDRIVARFEPRH